MEPVPAPKKYWIPDGSIAAYPSVFHDGSVHGGVSCVGCHGGDDSADSRAAAHSGSFRAVPLSTACASCHGTEVASSARALHTTLAGFEASMAARGVDLSDPVARARFDQQCTRCHTAADDGAGTVRNACGQCHVSVPATAGGGLLAGHAFRKTPSMDSNCTACHGSRVKDEYHGQNNALLGRNRAAFPDGSPWKDASFVLQPDVHRSAGKDCVFCHAGSEMHGTGAPTDDGRYAVSPAPACEDCHGGPADAAFAAVPMHQTARHLEAMSCQVCHAQPYKNCFECHVDVTEANVAFYRINQGCPTYDPDPAKNQVPDALLGFRAGRNPRFTGGGGEKEFVVLRHVPVDRDTFLYSGANAIPGLVGAMRARPTWFPATPHNIRRTTAITASCSNCHGADHAKFWLTDAVTDAHGWISPAHEADEGAANAGLLQPTPLPMSSPAMAR